jgi:hypothetical protein
MNTHGCKLIIFVVQPSRPPELNPLDFYLWGHVNTLVYSSVIENGQTLHQRILMSIKQFATPLDLCKGANVCAQVRPCVH